MMIILPNSPKFSPAKVLCYMVLVACTPLLCEVMSYEFVAFVAIDDYYFKKPTIPQPRVKNSDTSSKIIIMVNN